jgi:hypothetical protein
VIFPKGIVKAKLLDISGKVFARRSRACQALLHLRGLRLYVVKNFSIEIVFPCLVFIKHIANNGK